jgi:predicted nucleotidyltransferase
MITPKQMEIIRTILREHLNPNKIKVYLFGSRVRGNPRLNSDLDILIHGESLLPFSKMAFLREAFDESNLPYKADLSDFHSLDEAFRSKIASDLLPVVY